MVYVYILFVMAVSVLLTYAGAAIYRRYKDNQLDYGGYLAINDGAEDLIGDEWKGAEKVEEQLKKCNSVPGHRDYVPCTRLAGHDGPCAHPPKPVHEGNQVISLIDAKNQFDVYKKEELAKTPEIVAGSTYKYDSEYNYQKHLRDVLAHNAAYDRLGLWLKGKETRQIPGYQVCDPLAQIGRKAIPENVVEKWHYRGQPKQVKQEVIVPNEFITFMGNNGLSVDQVIQLSKQAMEFNLADKAPYAEVIRKNAVEKALKKERDEWLAKLRDIAEKVKAEKEDDAFHLKVVAEEKARLETEVEKLKAEVDALKENQKRTDQYRYDVKAVNGDGLSADATDADMEVTQGRGYTIYRTKAGGPVTSQIGVRKKSAKKKSKRKTKKRSVIHF